MVNVLQIVKKYSGNYPLLNEMVKTDTSKFRTVVCYLSKKNDGKNEIEKLVSRTIYIGYDKKLKLYRFSLVSELKRIIDEEDIHLVVCQVGRTIPLGVLASILSKKHPVVLGVHHGLVGKNKIRIKDKLKNWFFYKKLAKIVSVSQSGMDDILSLNWGLNKDKVVAIQNGLVYDRFLINLTRDVARGRVLPECRAKFLFGTVGRLTQKKNHRNLVIVFEKVVRKKPDSALIIAGGGPLEDSLKALVKSLKLQDRVFFLGVRKDIPEILISLDAFVFPTFREGLPLALLEAMSAGLPVIASDIGCIREVIDSPLLGMLINPESPNDLAKAMLEMVSSPEHVRKEMGERAKERAVEGFNAQRMTREYEKLYKEVLGVSF